MFNYFAVISNDVDGSPPNQIFSLAKPMQNALQTNNAFEAKNIMEKMINVMKPQIRNRASDDATRESMAKTMNILEQDLKAVQPGDESSMADIKNILEALLLFGLVNLGTGLSFITSPVYGIPEALNEGIKAGVHRSRKGDLLNTITGIGAGASYGLVDGLTNGQFAGVRAPLVLTSFVAQDALTNKNAAEAKRATKQYNCLLRKQISYDEQNKATHENFQKTLNAIDKRLDEVKPEDESSLKDIEKMMRVLILLGEIPAGYILGGTIGGPPDAILSAIREAIRTGSFRSCKGDLLNTLTGKVAGGLYGLNYGAFNGSYRTLRQPLKLI